MSVLIFFVVLIIIVGIYEWYRNRNMADSYKGDGE